MVKDRLRHLIGRTTSSVRASGKRSSGSSRGDGHVKANRSTGQVTVDGVHLETFDDHASVIGVEPDLRDVVIPSKVSTLPVTEIRRSAFQGASSIVSVVMPSEVISIGSRAFRNCSSLEYVELSSELTVINAACFENCKSLRVVMLPYELRRLCKRSFKNCRSLQRLPHFVKTGISATMRVDRSLTEENLPTGLEYIGSEAFADCVGLNRIVVPYKVTKLSSGVFRGCINLSSIWLHSNLQELADGVFAGCTSLLNIRVPSSVAALGEDCFPANTTVLCEEESPVHSIVGEHTRQVVTTAEAAPVSSMMGQDQGFDVDDLLKDDAKLAQLVNAYQIRPAVDEAHHDSDEHTPEVCPSRFTLVDGVYKTSGTRAETDDVTIAFTGDLMCRVFQQRHGLKDSTYDFSAGFESVQPVLQSADLTIGNMETMVAESFPYMHEKQYVDDRPHLNAPYPFLAAVRNAGFDVVLNAQNHMYDTGVKGVAETLSALNKAQLIHAGMYIHPEDRRFVLVELNGIRIGLVAYLDGARQKMKQSYFSELGLNTLASHFEGERVRKDISDARAAGAEFILACGHWGREYTENITARQERFAQMLVDSGADYVFGSHSHCPQQYTILESADGRRVPVVYSGGNFISDLGIRKPYTQDSVIGSLVLGRDEQGDVVIVRDGYIPCRIVAPRGKPGAVRVIAYEEGSDEAVSDEDRRRIAETMGNQYQQLAAESVVNREAYDGSDHTDVVSRHSLREPLMVRLGNGVDSSADSYRFDAENGLWQQPRKSAQGEASIICAGSILYDVPMETAGSVGEHSEFRSRFKSVRRLLRSADLSLGSFGSLVAPEYPSISTMTPALAGSHYTNAKAEYLDGLEYAGFDCLALAHPYNLDMGVRGLISTEQHVRESGIVPSGLGERKFPIFDVNGIRIAPVSYTLDSYKTRTMITGEGAKTLLNTFEPERVREQVKELRKSGVQFVIGYLDCRSFDQKYRYQDRFEAAKQMAELGVDYVICTLPSVVSKYTKYHASDGRIVPIASSLGTFISGRIGQTDDLSAAIRIVIRLREDMTLEIEDSYVPLKRFEHYGTSSLTVAPAVRQYNASYSLQDFKQVRTTLGKRLGEALALDQTRKVRMSTHNHSQLSLLEIQEVLGVRFSEQDRKKLGDKEREKIARVVTRKDDLTKGCVAVLVEHVSYRRDQDNFTVDDAVKAGAVCVIDKTPSSKIPTLVVKRPGIAFRKVLAVIRDRYDPITVAVTGTVGKTTTKELMSAVFDRHYRTLHIEGNNNTAFTTGVVLQKLTDEDEAYIQEVHGGSVGSAHDVSSIIKPDICLITNIGDGHLGQMGTIENVIKGKMQIIDGMRSDGTLVINDDNEYLHVQDPPVRTIRYSMSNPDCPYHAKNIVDDGERIEFQIVSPDGVFDALLNFQGLHNVSNAVAVFAVARLAGIPPYKITAGLSRYVPDSVRQNFCEVGGYRLLIDTYSSTPLSVISAVETLCNLPAGDNTRRIAVVGDIPDLGAKSEQDHLDVGQTIGRMPVDHLLCCGEDSRYLVEAAKREGMEAEYFEGRHEMNRALVELMNPGDIVLFKGGTRVHLKEQTIYPLFGKIV